MSRALRLVLLLLGIALLVAMVERSGPAVLLAQARAMGLVWIALVPVSLSWHLLNAWAWGRALGADRPPFPRLVQVHFAAEAVNNVTPLLSVGGEPLKVALLAGRVPVPRAAASVVGDGLVHLASGAVFVAAGLGLGLAAFPSVRGLLFPLGAAAAAMVVVALVLPHALSRGVLAPLARRLAGGRLLRGAFSLPLGEAAEEVDRHLGTFLRGSWPRLAACLVAHLGGRVMGAVEAWVILAAIGTPVSLAGAVFLIAVVHVLVNLAFAFVPSQLGVQEAAAYALFAAIGLDPAAAVSLSLIRRVRGLFWTGLGLLLLAPGRGEA